MPTWTSLYPAALDTLANLPPVSNGDSSDASHIDAPAASLIALEQHVGKPVAPAAGSLTDRVAALEGGSVASHKTSHQNGGSDEISVAGLSGVLADAQLAGSVMETSGPTTLVVGAVVDGEFLKRVGSTVVSAAVSAGAHKTTHENGGADEISVAGLSGVLADAQSADKLVESSGPTTLTLGVITDGEYLKRVGATVVSSTVTPGAHKTSHENGGSDEISVAGLSGVLADVQVAGTIRETAGPTDLVVGAVADGQFLRRVGATVVGGTPAGGGSEWIYLPTTQPAAMATPAVALYQFDGGASTLTDRTGNGHVLTYAAGSAAYGMVGSILGHYFGGTQKLWHNATPTALQLDREITVEIQMAFLRINAAEEHLFSISGASEVLNQNELCQLSRSAGSQLATVFVEYGAGVNSSVTSAMTVINTGDLCLLTFTRATDGLACNFYMNGGFQSACTLPNAAGKDISGNLQKLSIGNTTLAGVITSVKVTAAEFTPAQVLESYQRARGLIV